MSEIYVIGMGPGTPALMTPATEAALERAEVLCGYQLYLSLLGDRFADKARISTPMRAEVERCRLAVEAAASGKRVAVLCSGDAGVYGMAGLILEMTAGRDIPVEVIPGITAALSGAALLGAPLMNDFCVVSLSDLMTPWSTIEQRLLCAAEGDFVIVLYNPCSHHRPDHLRRACDLLLSVRSGDTVCGWARQIGREGQAVEITTLSALRDLPHLEVGLDMLSTVFIGSSATQVMDGRMVTPRGYGPVRQGNSSSDVQEHRAP